MEFMIGGPMILQGFTSQETTSDSQFLLYFLKFLSQWTAPKYLVGNELYYNSHCVCTVMLFVHIYQLGLSLKHLSL